MIEEPIGEIAGDSPQTHEEVQDVEEVGPTFDLSIFIEPEGILCQFQCEGRSIQWSVPKTVVRRAHKAMSIDHVFDLLGAGPIVGFQLCEAVTNDPEFLMVPRAVNALTDWVTKALRQVQKAQKGEAAAQAEATNGGADL